jgi:hypothetical protein
MGWITFSWSHEHIFEISVEFSCTVSNEKWVIANIYGPTIEEGGNIFTTWLFSLNHDDHDLWMILGDFNIMRSPNNRNRPGGDNNNMLLFNNIIQYLNLEEIPLKGRTYSWINMQNDPWLERLDWIFTSAEWASIYPDALATPLAKLSDHILIQISIGNSIPKANLFCFEEFWMDFDSGWISMASMRQLSNWFNKGAYKNPAQDMTARFKKLRNALNKWSRTQAGCYWTCFPIYSRTL